MLLWFGFRSYGVFPTAQPSRLVRIAQPLSPRLILVPGLHNLICISVIFFRSMLSMSYCICVAFLLLLFLGNEVTVASKLCKARPTQTNCHSSSRCKTLFDRCLDPQSDMDSCSYYNAVLLRGRLFILGFDMSMPASLGRPSMVALPSSRKMRGRGKMLISSASIFC